MKPQLLIRGYLEVYAFYLREGFRGETVNGPYIGQEAVIKPVQPYYSSTSH